MSKWHKLAEPDLVEVKIPGPNLLYKQNSCTNPVDTTLFDPDLRATVMAVSMKHHFVLVVLQLQLIE